MQTSPSFTRRLLAIGIAAGSLALTTLAAQVPVQQQTVEVVVSGAGGGIAGASTVLPGIGGITLPVDATGSGMIVGQVVDAGTGQPLGGAIVSIGGAIGGGGQAGTTRTVALGPGGLNLGGGGGNTSIPRVMTDSDGHFAFRSVPKGGFSLTAQKAGYLDGSYGRHRPNGESRQLTLEDGERTSDVVIKMFRPAAITGTVVDERGEPAVGSDVRAYKRDIVNGRRVLAPTGQTARVDDRGTYRLTNLTPGEYVVAVPTVQMSMPANFTMTGRLAGDLLSTMAAGGGTMSLSFGGGAQMPGEDRFVLQGTNTAPENNGALMAYPTIYYPAATVVSQATPIEVGSGEDRSGVDMTMRLVPTSHIAGRLMGPDGPASNYSLRLIPSDTGDLSTEPEAATTITAEDGSFAFLAVPAGQYVIQTVRTPRFTRVSGDTMVSTVAGGGSIMFTSSIQAGGAGAPPLPPAPSDVQQTLFTATPVSVGGTSIDNLSITLREGLKLSGRVEWEGSAERPTADRLQTISIVADAADGKLRAVIPPARLATDGTFTSPGLVPGKYLLRVANPPNAWTVKSIMANGVDASEMPIELSSRDLSSIVVTLTDKISDLHGSVRSTEGRADEQAAVIVFPSDNRSWMEYGVNPRRMRNTRTSKTGAYTFGALPAGSYYVVAIPEALSSQWQDPRFLEMLSREATPVTVGEGDKHTQDLTTRAIRLPGGYAPAPVATPLAIDANSWSPSIDESDRAHGPFVLEADGAQQSRDTRDTRGTAAGTTASISGVVLIDDGTGTPQKMRRARVALRGAEQRTERAVMTDDEGRFTLTNLPAGRYSLSATKPSFVTAYFGSRRPGRGPGTPLAVTAGQKAEGLTLHMAKGAVIAGQVLDETGQPFLNAQVRVLQSRMLNGERQLVPTIGGLNAGFAQTDDRGRFRIFGLTPGAYVVSVAAPNRGNDLRQLSTSDVQAVVADLKMPPPRQPGGGAAPAPDTKPLGGRTVGFAPVYYPGTTVATEASEVTVAAGQEVNGIDFQLRLVPTAKVQGTVVGPDGQPRPGVQLLIVPVTQTVEFGMGSTSMSRTAPDGKFSTGNLPPGRYTISARSGATNQVIEMGGGATFFSAERLVAGSRGGGPPAESAKPLWAQQDLDVNGIDINDISLTLQEGVTITGKLIFDGKSMATPDDLTRVRLNLLPAVPGRMSLGVPAARVNADGTFTLEGITPGAYRINANVPSTGFSAQSSWTIKSAVANGKDVIDAPLTVQPGADLGAVTVTFTDQSTELSGKVTDPAGEPVSDLTILVFPTDRSMWTPSSRRMRQPSQPGSDGIFKITGLPPGEYFLAAVTDLEQNDWGDPGFMEQVAAAALKLTLGEGEKKVQNLRIGG